MNDTPDKSARVFPVETRFQQMARRTGGVPREEAIEAAQTKVDEHKPGFEDWASKELDALTVQIRMAERGIGDANWVEAANVHCRQLRDVGTTMGFELLTYIANSLCEVLDAVIAGAELNMESITLHLDALLLSRQPRYRDMKPDQVPELTSGLKRVVQVVSTTPN